MHTTLRNKRIEVLAKIDALKDKCQCQTAEESKFCGNCKELNALGKQLGQLVKSRKNGVLGASINTDLNSSNFNFKVPQIKEGRKMIIDWSNHHEFLDENSELFTVKEMAEKLGVSAKNMKNYYDRHGLQYKPDELYEGKKYNYFVNGELVATGTIKDLAKQTGKHAHSMRNWRNRKGKNGEKVVAIE